MQKRLVLISSFIIFSLLLYFSSTVFSSPLGFVASLFSVPRASLYSFAHAQNTPTQLDVLQNENKKLREQLAQMNFLKQDNAALRNQFLDTTIPSEKLLPARVIGFKGSIFLPTAFILDQGVKSGVKKGMAVVIGHQLVGKIGNTSDYYSEVYLPINKNFTTLAVSTDNNTPGIIAGQEDFMLFGDIVITDTIAKDETVATKGEKDVSDVGIPSGLIIGKIKTVNKSETKPFQSAVVESLVDFKKLTTVFVVTK
ncbi:MAG: rod shape-determining protein MreC [Candidatus Levyibacteriota bacterium]